MFTATVCLWLFVKQQLVSVFCRAVYKLEFWQNTSGNFTVFRCGSAVPCHTAWQTQMWSSSTSTGILMAFHCASVRSRRAMSLTPNVGELGHDFPTACPGVSGLAASHWLVSGDWYILTGGSSKELRISASHFFSLCTDASCSLSYFVAMQEQWNSSGKS